MLLPLDRLPVNPTPNPARSIFLREFLPRRDVTSPDQQVDMPEIQDSFRVNFSEAALAASIESSRSVLQKATPTDERGATELQLRAYREMAAL